MFQPAKISLLHLTGHASNTETFFRSIEFARGCKEVEAIDVATPRDAPLLSICGCVASLLRLATRFAVALRCGSRGVISVKRFPVVS